VLNHLATSIAIFTLLSSTAQANQQYKPLSASVATVLQHSVADTASPRLAFEDEMACGWPTCHRDYANTFVTTLLDVISW